MGPKNIKKKYFTEYSTIFLGLSYSMSCFFGSLDGEFTVVGGVIETFYKSENPEMFFDAVTHRMAIGFIVAGVGLLMIYLQKNNAPEKAP